MCKAHATQIVSNEVSDKRCSSTYLRPKARCLFNIKNLVLEAKSTSDGFAGTVRAVVKVSGFSVQVSVFFFPDT